MKCLTNFEIIPQLINPSKTIKKNTVHDPRNDIPTYSLDYDIFTFLYPQNLSIDDKIKFPHNTSATIDILGVFFIRKQTEQSEIKV